MVVPYRYICIGIFMIIVNIALGQDIDSLESVFYSESNDRERAKTGLLISSQYLRTNLDKAYEFAVRSNELISDGDSIKIEALDLIAKYHYFKSELDSAKYYFEKAQGITNDLSDEKKSAALGLSIASILIRQADFESALQELIKSTDYFESIGDDVGAAKGYSNMSSAHAQLNNYPEAIRYSRKSLDIFKENDLDQFVILTMPNLATQLVANGDTTEAIAVFEEVEKLAIEQNSLRSLGIVYNNLGDLYLSRGELMEAKNYIEKSINSKKTLGLQKGLDNNYHNLGYIFAEQGNHQKAIILFNQALNLADASAKVEILKKLVSSNEALGKSNVALSFAQEALLLQDSIKRKQNAQEFADLSTKYETAKKENQILKLESDNANLEIIKNKNRTYLFGSLSLLVGLGLVSLLYNKNQRKKQLIRDQQNALAQQKLLDDLQRKESEALDRIVQGQNEERQKISADLHDSLGSKLAALKLFVDELDDQTYGSSEHLNRVRDVADNAYKEVRSISHLLNSGVLVDQGLIPAIKEMSAFISETKGIHIDVIDIDTPERLENRIEIQIFRIIQELLTNIVKHANANKVLIQLTTVENNLNVTMEDNGSGFAEFTAGFGLQNVARRITELNGSQNIQSDLGKGTSIEFSIPL